MRVITRRNCLQCVADACILGRLVLSSSLCRQQGFWWVTLKEYLMAAFATKHWSNKSIPPCKHCRFVAWSALALFYYPSARDQKLLAVTPVRQVDIPGAKCSAVHANLARRVADSNLVFVPSIPIWFGGITFPACQQFWPRALTSP